MKRAVGSPQSGRDARLHTVRNSLRTLVAAARREMHVGCGASQRRARERESTSQSAREETRRLPRARGGGAGEGARGGEGESERASERWLLPAWLCAPSGRPTERVEVARGFQRERRDFTIESIRPTERDGRATTG